MKGKGKLSSNRVSVLLNINRSEVARKLYHSSYAERKTEKGDQEEENILEKHLGYDMT